MVVLFIIKIIFNFLYFLPLFSGEYCFSSVQDQLRHVCQDLQPANDTDVEDCCTIRNITNGGGGFAEVLIKDFPTLTNDTYECTLCSSIRVADHWTEWSECSVTCGDGGITSRSRKCALDRTKPPGMKCYGESTESKRCRDLPTCETHSDDSFICVERIALIIVTILLIITIIIFIGFFIYVKWKKKLQEKKALVSKILSVQRKSEGAMSSSSMIFHKGVSEQTVSDVTDDYITPTPFYFPASDIQRKFDPSVLNGENSERQYTDITFNDAELRNETSSSSATLYK